MTELMLILPSGKLLGLLSPVLQCFEYCLVSRNFLMGFVLFDNLAQVSRGQETQCFMLLGTDLLEQFL